MSDSTAFVAAVTGIFASLPPRAASLESDCVSPLPPNSRVVDLPFRKNYGAPPPKVVAWLLLKGGAGTPTLLRVRHADIAVDAARAKVTLPADAIESVAGGRAALYWIVYTQTRTNPVLTATLEQIFAHPASFPKSLETAVDDCVRTCGDVNESDRLGQTLLHAASTAGNCALITWLLARGANVDARDEKGWTPMHAATSAAQPEAAQQLLAAGATAQATCERGMTALHVLCRWSTFNRKQVLLARQLVSSGLSVNVVNEDGETPLLYLCKKRDHSVSLATALLEMGADATRADAQGVTPLHVAAQRDNVTLAELLIQHGADALAVASVDGASRTPLDIAYRRGVPKMLAALVVVTQLPMPAIENVMRFLEPRDMMRAARTCKFFQRAAATVFADQGYWRCYFGVPRELYRSLWDIRGKSFGQQSGPDERAALYKARFSDFIVLPEELASQQPVARMLLTVAGAPKSGKQSFIRQFCVDESFDPVAVSAAASAAMKAASTSMGSSAGSFGQQPPAAVSGRVSGSSLQEQEQTGSPAVQHSALADEGVFVGSFAESTVDANPPSAAATKTDESAVSVAAPPPPTTTTSTTAAEEDAATVTTEECDASIVPFYSKAVVRLNGKIVELFFFALGDDEQSATASADSPFKQFWQLSAACVLLLDVSQADAKECSAGAERALNLWRSVCGAGKEGAVLAVGFKSDSAAPATTQAATDFATSNGFPFLLANAASEEDDSVDFAVKVACEVANEAAAAMSAGSPSSPSTAAVAAAATGGGKQGRRGKGGKGGKDCTIS